MARSAIAQVAKKYATVILFPTFTFTTIYADWSHTQEWKRKQKEISQTLERLRE